MADWETMLSEPVWAASRLSLIIISLAVLLCFLRLRRGPTLADRVVALDMIATLLVGMLLLYGMAEEEPEFLRVAMVLALINFLGTIGFAMFILRRDRT